MHFAIMLIICGFLAVATGASADDRLNALYEKAKKEGQVVLAAGSPPQAIKAQIGGFMKRFPGVRVNHIPSTGADASTKIQIETRVGMSTYEVAQATTTSAERLLQGNLLSSFPYHTFGIAKEEIAYDQRLVPWFDLTYALGFNTKLVSKDEVPTTWEGLLDPKWKGRKIITVGRGYPYGDLTAVWGTEKMKDYVTKLRAQNPIILPRGGPQTLEALVARAGTPGDHTVRSRPESEGHGQGAAGLRMAVAHFGDPLLLHRRAEGPQSPCPPCSWRGTSAPRRPRGSWRRLP